VIFILLLVAATNATVRKFQQARGRTANDRDKLIKRLKEAFPDIDIKADTDPLGVVVVLPNGLLNFVRDKPDIPVEGRAYLQRFIPRLAGVVCARPDTVRSVVIQGYTDDTGPDLHNVVLSQERASAVAEEALTILTQADRKDYACFLGMMSASGRGKNDLIYIDRQKDKVDEDRSRRVEFHLRVPSFEQRDAQKSIRQAAGSQSQVDFRHE
jgi:outer membrane protein OmpA-like peptidoglycan-associated protein